MCNVVHSEERAASGGRSRKHSKNAVGPMTDSSVYPFTGSEAKDHDITMKSDVTINCDVKSVYQEQLDVIAREHKKSVDTLKHFAKMLCLSVAYASNIGGLATLTGTPTNLFVAQYANQSVKPRLFVFYFLIIIFRFISLYHMWLATAATSVMFYIASVHWKRFVYVISLNQPKVYTVDDQSSARH